VLTHTLTLHPTLHPSHPTHLTHVRRLGLLMRHPEPTRMLLLLLLLLMHHSPGV
jgi:hypothetical protein